MASDEIHVSDSEVINVMISGGERVCDHAIDCNQNKYPVESPHMADIFQENVKRWKKTKSRIREIANEMKSNIREQA